MFVVRRIFKVKKGTARQACEVLTQMGDMYGAAGLRKPSRIYYSGSTTPGPKDTVYMEWLEEELKSAYRADNPKPPQEDALFDKLSDLQEETWIEFYEHYSGE